MSQQVLLLRALVASPGDVQEERNAIPRIIAAWNAEHSRQRAIYIDAVKWETHATPGLEGRPQAMINRQLVSDCDFLVGVFWTRLGTDTGVAESGTAEEIEEFRKSGKKVLLYFSDRPVVPSSIDQGQYRRLSEYREKLGPLGLLEQYTSLEDFERKLGRHLTSVVDEIVKSAAAGKPPGNAPSASPGSSTTAASVPAPVRRMTSEEQSALEQRLLFSQIEAFCRRITARWKRLRDTASSTGDGDVVLKDASAELEELATMTQGKTSPVVRDRLLSSRNSMDRLWGRSTYAKTRPEFNDYWDVGDMILSELKEFVEAAASLPPR